MPGKPPPQAAESATPGSRPTTKAPIRSATSLGTSARRDPGRCLARRPRPLGQPPDELRSLRAAGDAAQLDGILARLDR
jgi:hypothetical protein